ncbi:MAG TPA: response regulator transcription factor [Pyrinomonadaceae bacterium]|nr:response regulator transcription factor [Pyrinomonadaceae bacterium]
MIENMSEEKPIRILIVEDQRNLREGLETLINFTPGFECSGAFRTMEDALHRAKHDLPDVVLTDIGLPGMSGIEGIAKLKESYPDLLILVLTVYDDNEKIFDALCAGACGYLLKQTEPSELLKSLREAVTGGAPMSPEVAAKVIKIFREVRPPEKADYDLTPHETRLLKMLTEGYNYVSAAEKLGISYNTLKFHVRNIYDKLQVHSQSEAVAVAMRDRLV